jgi:hypothetical protein
VRIHNFAEEGGVLQLALLFHLLPLYVQLRFGRHGHQVDVLLSERHTYVRMTHHWRRAAQLVPLVSVAEKHAHQTSPAPPPAPPDNEMAGLHFQTVNQSKRHQRASLCRVMQLPTCTLTTWNANAGTCRFGDRRRSAGQQRWTGAPGEGMRTQAEGRPRGWETSRQATSRPDPGRTECTAPAPIAPGRHMSSGEVRVCALCGHTDSSVRDSPAVC